jgi:hypothetical protein
MGQHKEAHGSGIKLTEHVRRRIALDASVDPRTVTRYCQGLPVKGRLAVERIEDALRKAGLLPGVKE